MDTHDDDGGLVIQVAGEPAPGASIPVLNEELPPLDLPPRATQQADGTILLELEFPKTLEFRPVGGGAAVRSERFESLTFRRLKGPEVRRLMDVKNATDMAVAISTGLTASKYALLRQRMDSADVGAAEKIVSELLGDMSRQGLPAHADETPDGIRLPLFFPAADGDGATHTELLFKRLTGADRQAIANAQDVLGEAIRRAVGITPKAAKELVNDMDGADVVATQKVIGFLSGNGRRTGG